MAHSQNSGPNLGCMHGQCPLSLSTASDPDAQSDEQLHCVF